MSIFVNLTPDVINVRNSEKKIMTIPPSGHVARIKKKREYLGQIRNIEISKTTDGALEGLENLKWRRGEILITAPATLARVQEKYPEALVVSPGPLIRDQNAHDGFEA